MIKTYYLHKKMWFISSHVLLWNTLPALQICRSYRHHLVEMNHSIVVIRFLRPFSHYLCKQMWFTPSLVLQGNTIPAWPNMWIILPPPYRSESLHHYYLFPNDKIHLWCKQMQVIQSRVLLGNNHPEWPDM